MKSKTHTMGSIERSKIIDERVLEVLHPNKELSASALRVATDSSNTGIDSSVGRLIASGKVERIKNPEREYAKPSYLFRLV